MSAVNAPDGRSPGKSVAAIVLAVIGVLFLILGVVYATVPAHSLPSYIGHIKHGGTGKHDLRMAVSFVVGILCLGGAWFTRKGGGKASADASASASAGSATRE